MKDLETLLYRTDFSKHTDLKDRLHQELFSSSGNSGKISSFPFRSLSDDELDMVSAARGYWDGKQTTGLSGRSSIPGQTMEISDTDFFPQKTMEISGTSPFHKQSTDLSKKGKSSSSQKKQL